jgi:RNA polymerase sigma-70 factor (ECF subfamily)
MATRRALDRLRRRKPIADENEIASLPSTENPIENAIARELESRLRHAVAELPPREAEVFCLRCFDGLSYVQIAELLGISQSAVSTALNKARGRLEPMFDAARAE